MSVMVIVQVVPKLFPAIDGVGDYALNLARQLRLDFGIETHFIVGDPTWPSSTHIEGFPISQVRVHANTLLSLLPSERQYSTIVLLHYVNYGYAKRGCPVWLVNDLQRWRTLADSRLLITMFHEIYASGPPWASSFWLSPLQKNLAARLATVSDRTFTSRQNYAKILHELSKGKHVAIPALPVFSNIGEPEQVPTLAKRERRLVVFGGRSNRLRVYQKSLAELELTCCLLKIDEIWDIGPPTGLILSSVNKVPVVEKGQMSNTQISDILLGSLAGFFNYNLDYLAKSTIFAAYCAHGLLPVSPRGNTSPVDGIQAGKHYWTPDDQRTSWQELVKMQAIADNAHSWYHTHNLSIQARTFAAHLAGNLAT